MPDDSNDIRRSFVAERRNLLITSFALFFYQQAGLQVEKINILGNEAKISDPWWIASLFGFCGVIFSFGSISTSEAYLTRDFRPLIKTK